MENKKTAKCGNFITAWEEDSGVSHKGYTLSNKFYFEKEEAKEIANIHTYKDATMDQKVWYDEQNDCFVCRDDVNFSEGYHDIFNSYDLETEDGIKHVYDFSSWNWYVA